MKMLKNLKEHCKVADTFLNQREIVGLGSAPQILANYFTSMNCSTRRQFDPLQRLHFAVDDKKQLVVLKLLDAS